MATITHLGELTLEEAAQQSAGNWRTWECFVWWRDEDLESPEDWMIHYTHHRDSGLLDQSNALQIRKSILPFLDGDDPDVVMESHSHFLVGHINGFSLRVYREGQITEAFRTFHQQMESLVEYPILDEQDYSNREYEATIQNILDAASQLKQEYNLPNEWQYDVHSWLSDHEPSEIENMSDQGGYPSEESLRRAMEALMDSQN